MTCRREGPGNLRHVARRQLPVWIAGPTPSLLSQAVLATRSECDSATAVAARGRPSVRTLAAHATCQRTPPSQYDPVSVRGAP